MTPTARLSAALATLHWGPATLSRLLGVSERSARYWLTGRYDPPADVLAWVEGLAAYVAAVPVPRRGDRAEEGPGGQVPGETREGL